MAYVAIDIGHGENTFNERGSKGVYRNGKAYEEHHFNADVGQQIKEILEEHGVDVLLTQSPYKRDVGLNYRTDLANREGVDAFVSIHANAGVPDASGACVFAWEGFERTNQLADHVRDELKAQGIDLHGNGRHYSQFNSWTNFHVLRETNMSAILIEHGFMTNDQDFENIFGRNSKEYRKKCAIADAKGILEWFGIEYKDDKPDYQTAVQPKEEEKEVSDIHEVSSWAKDDWEEATENGYFDGNRPGADITREEAAIVVNRIRHNFLELIEANEKEIDELKKTLKENNLL